MTTKTTDVYWSELYDDGSDYRFITFGELSKILLFTNIDGLKTCLDIGCGTGQLTREIFHRGYQCVGMDVSASAVRIASSLTTVPREKLQYVHFDIEHDDVGTLPLTHHIH